MKVNDLANLYVCYNEEENFRLLVCAMDPGEAQEIAKGYCADTKMEGTFEIEEFNDTDLHFDCDYVLTKE